MIDLKDAKARIAEVKARIAEAAVRSGRKPEDVTLIAVSKTVSAERVLEAIEAGVTNFGENRVREAEEKFARLGVDSQSEFKVPREGIRLHMIGSLQRNKARHAIRLFDWVHSLDRPELAEALETTMSEERPGETLPVLLQVNYTGEDMKSGVEPGELPDLLGAVSECTHLRPTGLMVIARLGADEAELRETFAGMRGILESLQQDYPSMRHLSMGMTDDYEVAIEEGATMVRIGRAIFGERV